MQTLNSVEPKLTNVCCDNQNESIEPHGVQLVTQLQTKSLWVQSVENIAVRETNAAEITDRVNDLNTSHNDVRAAENKSSRLKSTFCEFYTTG